MRSNRLHKFSLARNHKAYATLMVTDDEDT